MIYYMGVLMNKNIEKIRIGIAHEVSKKLLMGVNVSFNEIEKSIRDVVLLRVEGFIYGEKKEVKIIKYPSNWVQSLKERFFTKYLKNISPVKYTIHEVSFNILYPDAIDDKKLGNPIFKQEVETYYE
jgi:hypothetical protein